MWSRHQSLSTKTVAKCKYCSQELPLISQSLGLCSDCIRHHFDLKAWTEKIHIALCGVSNNRTLANFRLLARYTKLRPSPPLVIASTLLVPGYVGKEEVTGIATFISSLDPDIPYALLAFHPDFLMVDLPATSNRQATECLEAARAAGLSRVRLGNIHLLH